MDGIEIEYFQNLPEQIRAEMRQERQDAHQNNNNPPITSHIMAHGEVRYQRSPFVAKLVKEAKVIWAQASSPAQLKPVQVELLKYNLNDIWKDLFIVLREKMLLLLLHAVS